MNVADNTSLFGGMLSGETNAFVNINNSNAIYIFGNCSLSNGTYLLTGTGNSNCSVARNSDYVYTNLNESTFLPEQRTFIVLKTMTANDISTGIEYTKLPDKFYVRLNDGYTMFECSRANRFISSTVSQKSDGTGFYTLRWLWQDDVVVPMVTEYNYAGITSGGTARAYTVVVMAAI